jgi:hypothetical protein
VNEVFGIEPKDKQVEAIRHPLYQGILVAKNFFGVGESSK